MVLHAQSILESLLLLTEHWFHEADSVCLHSKYMEMASQRYKENYQSLHKPSFPLMHHLGPGLTHMAVNGSCNTSDILQRNSSILIKASAKFTPIWDHEVSGAWQCTSAAETCQKTHLVRFVHDPWHMFARQMSVWRRGGSHHSISVPLQCVLFPPKSCVAGSPPPHCTASSTIHLSPASIRESQADKRLILCCIATGTSPPRWKPGGGGGRERLGEQRQAPWDTAVL